MATGTVAPYPRLQFFDDSGNPLNGGLLYTYAAGTSTPLATYSDVTLTTPNANPTVLDAAGRATIFLSAASYKFTLRTSAGTLIWTADNVSAVPATSIASSFNSVTDGRLTALSGNPVPDSTPGGNFVYYTPYTGNRIALFDGSQWNLVAFTEVSLSVIAVPANTVYDVFAYNNGGAVTLERVNWASATARATALALQDGVWVKSGDATRRYLGTCRSTSGGGDTTDTTAQRFVWNYYHRVRRPMRVLEATDTWTYTTATYRQANGATANQLALVVGVQESLVRAEVHAHVANTAAGVDVQVAIGLDSTTTPATNSIRGYLVTQSANNSIPVKATYEDLMAIGYHTLVWLERSAATGTTTWYGDGGLTTLQTGIVGSVEG